MSILLVSPDEDAARALSSALARAGEPTHWERSAVEVDALGADDVPLVLVADASDPGHAEVISNFRKTAPWVRVFVMTEAGTASLVNAPRVAKPFDATETAMLLARERELAELERRRQTIQGEADDLALLVEASFEAIVGLDHDGTIRTWNRGAREIYGYAPEEAIGKNIRFLEVSPDRQAPATTPSVVEAQRRRNDGAAISVLLSQSPISATGNERLAFAEVSLDITARKKLERELEHSERLAAVGRLVATMAHEINNPLAVIAASTSYIGELAERINDDDLADCVADMELAATRIADFVQHMCGFARRERPHLSETRPSETVRMALRLVQPRARDRKVDIEVRVKDDPPVPQDPPRLSQAVVNVLANAIDAAADGDRHVWVTIERQGAMLHIIVEDDGMGFDAETSDRLFDPFHTTKPHGGGTGLGLTIARQIMSDHRGQVWLQPREGGGARAALTLPLLDPARYRILVIEDDPAVRRALSGELRREGFEVDAAESYQDAVRQLESADYRVIVTDVRLPDLSGRELISALRQQAPRARCIAITGEPDVPRLREADIQLAKPWDRKDLLTAVRQLCVSVSELPVGPVTDFRG